MAVRPAAQAASVVLAETRPMPSKSMAESVVPGLKPYQPNQRIKPPEAAMVRSCGSMGPPPSRLNLRPRRGPRTMEPARAMNAADGVDDRGAGKVMEALTESWAGSIRAMPMVARKPSGPQAQWPMMG